MPSRLAASGLKATTSIALPQRDRFMNHMNSATTTRADPITSSSSMNNRAPNSVMIWSRWSENSGGEYWADLPQTSSTVF